MDCGCKLIARDGRDNKVSVPRFLFRDCGCLCCFAGRNRGESIDGVIGWGCHGDGECRAAALQVEDWILEEAKVSFAMTPGARNGHEVGGEFLF